MNPASLLPLAAGGGVFTQPSFRLFLHVCTVQDDNGGLGWVDYDYVHSIVSQVLPREMGV